MEASESANRRLNCIAGHLNANQQSSSYSSPLATLACSARLDNRALYARQARTATAYTIADIEPQEFVSAVNGPNLQSGARKDNRLLFSRQARHTQSFFMRESVISEVTCPTEEPFPQPKILKCAEMVQNPCNTKQCDSSSSDEPMFARPQQIDGGSKMENVEALFPIAKDNGLGWLPRMDVAESRAAYVITVELPGVNADGIRVEVNNERLLISGTRATTEWWGEHAAKYDKVTLYRRKELAEGPYRVTLPIPKDSQKSLISAEFVDGFLRIFIPKINT